MGDKIQLILEWPEQGDDIPGDTAWMDGVDGLVVDPCHCDLAQFEKTGVERAVIRNGDPEHDGRWRDHASGWVRDGGLEQVAQFRDEHPALQWIPRLEVSKEQLSYRFSGTTPGEGFSFYMPDTAAIKGWRINGAECSLHEAITRATELGFSTLWLHSPEAEVQGKGLELDLLDKFRGGPLQLWLSGGAADPTHLRNLAKAGGAAAVVVGERLARASTMQALREVLAPEEPVPEAVPIHFERRPVQEG